MTAATEAPPSPCSDPASSSRGPRTSTGGRWSRPPATAPSSSCPRPAPRDAVFDMWADMGLKHFGRLRIPAEVVPLKTREDAERPETAARLATASLAYFSGGNPAYLATMLLGTPFWSELLAAVGRGMGYTGCSAGIACLGELAVDSAAHMRGETDLWKPGLRMFHRSSSALTGTPWTPSSPACSGGSLTPSPPGSPPGHRRAHRPGRRRLGVAGHRLRAAPTCWRTGSGGTSRWTGPSKHRCASLSPRRDHAGLNLIRPLRPPGAAISLRPRARRTARRPGRPERRRCLGRAIEALQQDDAFEVQGLRIGRVHLEGLLYRLQSVLGPPRPVEDEPQLGVGPALRGSRSSTAVYCSTADRTSPDSR